MAGSEYYQDLVEETESILDSVKVQCGIPVSHHEFDQMIQLDINTALGILHQLGVGDPRKPFTVSDADDTWADFTCQVNMEMCKTFIALKVRELFDPPSGAAMDALKRNLDELTWRITVAVEEDLRVNHKDWEED